MAMAGKEPTTRIVRQLRSGQVTIPADFRKQLGIAEDTLLQMTLVQGELRIKPVRVRASDEGADWFKELYERFAPIREEATQFSEAEIDAELGRALGAVRKKNA